MTTKSVATRFPIDFESLKKGDVISVDVIRQAYNVEPGTEAYSFAMLKMVTLIRSRLRSDGKDWVVRTSNYTIEILTDEDAVPYLIKRFEHHENGLVHSSGLMVAVDPSKLSDEAEKTWDRYVKIQAMLVSALTMKRQEIRAVERRAVAELEGPEDKT